MKNKDLVSILIPLYNHEKYIEYCLNSILKDDYKNVQIDIIDDGSSDNSVAIVKSWIKINPKINIRLSLQKNKGQIFTLNKLIDNAKGKYMCLLASDDALIQGGLLKRVNYLKKFPRKLAVIGDAKVIDDSNLLIYDSAIEDLYKGDKEKLKDDDSLKYSIINEFCIPGPVLLFKKELFKKIGPYPNIFAEDIFFYLKVIGLELLVYLDEPVALYRVHENNTGGNTKFSREINKTFIISYWLNLKHYSGIYKLMLIKKMLGRVVQRLKYYVKI